MIKLNLKSTPSVIAVPAGSLLTGNITRNSYQFFHRQRGTWDAKLPHVKMGSVAEFVKGQGGGDNAGRDNGLADGVLDVGKQLRMA